MCIFFTLSCVCRFSTSTAKSIPEYIDILWNGSDREERGYWEMTSCWYSYFIICMLNIFALTSAFGKSSEGAHCERLLAISKISMACSLATPMAKISNCIQTASHRWRRSAGGSLMADTVHHFSLCSPGDIQGTNHCWVMDTITSVGKAWALHPFCNIKKYWNCKGFHQWNTAQAPLC